MVRACDSGSGSFDCFGAGCDPPRCFTAYLWGRVYGYLSRHPGHLDSLFDRVRYPWSRPAAPVEFALYLGLTGVDPDVFRLCCRRFSGLGCDSVHHSQRSAALSLGLTERQVMREVVLPASDPKCCSQPDEYVDRFAKGVSLLSFIGPVEIFQQAGVFKSLLANFTPT